SRSRAGARRPRRNEQERAFSGNGEAASRTAGVVRWREQERPGPVKDLASLAILVKGRSCRQPPPARQGCETSDADGPDPEQDHRRGSGGNNPVQFSVWAGSKEKDDIADGGVGGDAWGVKDEGCAVLEPGVELAVTDDVTVGCVFGRAKDHVVR